MNKLTLSTIIASTMLLTACGGSGSSSSPKTTPLVDKSNFAVGTIQPEVQEGETLVDFTVKVGDKTYANGSNINFADFDNGLTETTFSSETNTKGKDINNQDALFNYSTSGNFYLFKQDYSALAAVETLKEVKKENGVVVHSYEPQDDVEFVLKGTPTTTLPTAGTFTYKGTAHAYDIDGVRRDGITSYSIDFDKKVGSGELSSIDGKNVVELAQASIDKFEVKNNFDESTLSVYGVQKGQATYGKGTGTYGLGIFGPDANEIIGHFDVGTDADNLSGIFGGKKQ